MHSLHEIYCNWSHIHWMVDVPDSVIHPLHKSSLLAHFESPLWNIQTGVIHKLIRKKRKLSDANIAHSNLNRSRPDTSVARVIVSCHKFLHLHFCRRFEAEIYCGPKYWASPSRPDANFCAPRVTEHFPNV